MKLLLVFWVYCDPSDGIRFNCRNRLVLIGVFLDGNGQVEDEFTDFCGIGIDAKVSYALELEFVFDLSLEEARIAQGLLDYAERIAIDVGQPAIGISLRVD